MLRTIGAALVVAYAPGALALRLPFGRRDRRAAIPADERAFWAVIISLAWSVGVTMALAALGRYTFERLLIADGAATLALLIASRGSLGYQGLAPRPTAMALVPAAIVSLGLYLYFPPSEYIIGGKDPGDYVNEGVQIAQRGALTVRDPVVASVPPAFRDLFFPSYRQPTYYSLRFMGFFIQDPDVGSVIGQFPQLFPASIAIGYGLNGLSGARQAVGVWAILGLLAVYFVGARMFGRAPAAAAVALLAINVAEVWFARYPNSELMMQALLFAAMLAFSRAIDDGRGFFGTIAGALLGLMVFLRYETLLAIFTFGLVAAVAPVVRQRVGAAFVVALAIVGALGLWYLEIPMRAYSELPLRFTRESGGWWAAGGCLAAAWAMRWTFRWPWARALVGRAAPAALGVALGALAVYAFFFRQVGPGLAPHDAESFRTFAWYLSGPVLAIGCVGAAVLTATLFWRNGAFFLTVAAFSMFFFYKTRIVPEHFWAARRFLVAPLPAILLFTAVLADQTFGVAGLRRIARRFKNPDDTAPGRLITIVGTALLVAALAPIAVSFWRASAPVRRHVEYAGLIPKIEQLTGSIGDRDLLLVESRNAGSDLHVLAVPLAYIYARNVLVLNSPTPEKQPLEGFVAWARSRYDRVLFLGGGGTDLLTSRLAAEPVGGDQFNVPEYDARLNAYPEGVRRKQFEYGLYQLVPREPPPPGPIDLRIGALDDLNVVRFHAKEKHGQTGELFRWTQGQSFVLLLGLSPSARSLTIWMSDGGRPPQAPPADVEVALDDHVLGVIRPGDTLAPHTLPLPPEVAADVASRDTPARLRLRVATWNPGALLHTSDTRALGVMVTRVEVK